jgi:hypothetical protein
MTRGLSSEEMVVHRGNLKTRGSHFRHDGIQLALKQNQSPITIALSSVPRKAAQRAKRQDVLGRQSVNGSVQITCFLARPPQGLIDRGRYCPSANKAWKR